MSSDLILVDSVSDQASAVVNQNVVKEQNNQENNYDEIIKTAFDTQNVNYNLLDSCEFLLGGFLYNSSNIAKTRFVIKYNCHIFYLSQSLKLNLPYNNFILFNACIEALSAAFASNRVEYFFKYGYLCTEDKYIGNVFSVGWNRKNQISEKVKLDIIYGFGFIVNTNLFYTENDKNILFNKYSLFSMINPMNYRYFFSTYLELGIKFQAIYLLFRLIDLDATFFCSQQLGNMLRNLIQSRYEKRDTENRLGDIYVTNIDTGFLIKCDIMEIFSFLKSNINNFGYNGDW